MDSKALDAARKEFDRAHQNLIELGVSNNFADIERHWTSFEWLLVLRFDLLKFAKQRTCLVNITVESSFLIPGESIRDARVPHGEFNQVDGCPYDARQPDSFDRPPFRGKVDEFI